MGEISVKIYDKFGSVLRIEVTYLNVSKINIFRDVQKRDGTIEKERKHKGFNFFSKSDETILLAIADGKNSIYGLSNKELRKKLVSKTSGQISRILKRLSLLFRALVL